VHARLWEDPLAASYGDQETSGSWWESELQRVLREGEQEPTLRQLRRDMQTVVGRGLKVMPVFLPGGPYEDDREQRLRIRYALLSALGELGYQLKYPNRMSYVRLPVQVAVPPTAERPDRPNLHRHEIVVPLKLFQAGSSPDSRVLVLWINETQLGERPLAALTQVLEQLFTAEDAASISLRIVGPTNSDALATIATEDRRAGDSRDCRPGRVERNHFHRYQDATLLSTRATITVDGSSCSDLSTFLRTSKTGLQVVRAIGSDKALVTAMEREISLRCILPSGARNPHQTVLLVTERDTSYGRAFRTLFGASGSKVKEFCYLRGIDGKLPGPAEERDPAGQAKEATVSQEQAVGRAQSDYLRRIDQQIRHDFPTVQERSGVAAVGILGTDVYDKLLIVRALRPGFPRAWFFTTDLDARFLDPEEQRWARNLLVASHFGLELNPALLDDCGEAGSHDARHLPFRDSYQTAVYFAALLSLNHELGDRLKRELGDRIVSDPWGLNADSQGMLEPLVFEVGRDGFYQLTLTRDRGANHPIQPRSPREQRRVQWNLVAGCGILLVLCLYAQSTTVQNVIHGMGTALATVSGAALWVLLLPAWYLGAAVLPGWAPPLLRFLHPGLQPWHRSRRAGPGDWAIAAGVVIMVALVWIITRDHARPDGEPFTLARGVSVWPATLIHYAAACLAVTLLFKGRAESQLNLRRIQSDYLGLAVSQSTLHRETSRGAKQRSRPSVAAWVSPRFAGLADCGGTRQVWHRYFAWSAGGRRCVRVGLSTLAYFGFAFLVFRLTDFPNLPARGTVSIGISFVAVMAAVLFMYALVFYAIDQVRGCGCLVRDLGRAAPDWHMAARCGTDEIPGAWREKATVEVIASRSKVVGKLLTYPFWVLLLMIVSRWLPFDYMPFSLPLVLVLALLLGALAVSYISLRVVAEAARSGILQRIQERLVAVLGQPDSPRADQIREVMEAIGHETDGAFRPLTRDFLFRGLAIPLGGAGGLALIEQLLT
jgi:hypothetical protein